jgi:hypothetical protein
MTNQLIARVCVAAAAWACAVSAGAQDGPTAALAPGAADGGQTQIVAAAQPGRLTRTLDWAEAKVDGQTTAGDGFYPEMGGMIPGAGLSAGPGYRHHLGAGGPIVDASMAMSWRRYSMMQSRITWPQLLHDRVSAGAQIKYQDFTQVDFFGIGSGSLKDDRTDYRLKNLDALGFATVRANARVSFTGRGGLLRQIDRGSGSSTLVPSIETRFDEGSAPALSQQPNYLHADIAMDVDTRDVPGYASSGSRYHVAMAAFHDQNLGRFSFTRFDADAVHYVPLGRTVFALRGKVGMTQTGAGQDVPFYMLPTLGGSNSLRGYLDYRFRDRDLLLADAEYRFPIARRVDAALFYDAGTVAPQASGLTANLTADYGVGLRLHSATHLIARVDLARGREGMRALLSFSAPLALAKSTTAPSVP